jgi:hypothetical protein
MKYIILFLILNTSFLSENKILDTASTKYFPLSVGNKYVYETHFGPPPDSSYSVGLITKDTIIYGVRYYYCKGFPSSDLPILSNGWYRTDSLTGSLYRYGGSGCIINGNDVLVDSLAMRSGSYNCGSLIIYCLGENSSVLFGIQTKDLSFKWNFGSGIHTWTYTKYFGFSYTGGGQFYYSSTHLIGCIINGVLFGDTSIPTGIRTISEIEPETFSLFQNYPNPFNPTSKIKFSIPLNKGGERGLFMRLTIYDLLGREVATLVNEQLKPGTYEVEWDGTNYPSGVYFYKLSTDSYNESKKMVLIK